MKNNLKSPMKKSGFTLIELLVVISIIGVLAAFTIPVLGQLKVAQYKKVARAELEVIQTALENYKAKYGTYPPSNQYPTNAYVANTPPMHSWQFPQLYYELAGTTLKGNDQYFETLDGSRQISKADVFKAYKVDGFVNSTKGAGEDVAVAKNFLINLRPKQTAIVSNNTVETTALVTSIGGPDANYLPFGPNTEGLNPIRYVYPGVNNPAGYDLWIKFQVKNKTYLVCNWSRQITTGSPLP